MRTEALLVASAASAENDVEVVDNEQAMGKRGRRPPNEPFSWNWAMAVFARLGCGQVVQRCARNGTYSGDP